MTMESSKRQSGFTATPITVKILVFSYLDAYSLSTCAQVSLEFWEATDHPCPWQQAALSYYPHAIELADNCLYSDEWKYLLLDRNRRNRSTLFTWLVTECLRETHRRYSPIFTLDIYSFQLIVDPCGNPYVPLAKPGVSVYICCCPTDNVMGIDADGRMEMANNQDPWECCLTFALTVCNQQGLKRNLTWSSNLQNDCFGPGCREWGVHRLISLRRLRDHQNGYLGQPGDILKLQVRLRMLRYKIRIFDAAVLRGHDSFGIADFSTPSFTSTCMVPPLHEYEPFHCTKVPDFHNQVARDLGLAHANQLRLWIVTQPWADCPATPRELMRGTVESEYQQGVAGQHEEAGGPGPIVPLLANLLHAHQDGVGEVRVFAEISGDGMLVEQEGDNFCSGDGILQREIGGSEAQGQGDCKRLRSGREIPRGEKLGDPCALDAKPIVGRMVPTKAGNMLPVIEMLPKPTEGEDGEGQLPLYVPPHQAVPAAAPPVAGLPEGLDGADMSGDEAQAVSTPSRGQLGNQAYIMLFVKYFQPPPATPNNGDTGQLRFLNHVLVKASGTPRLLWKLVGQQVRKPPTSLRVHVEEAPNYWQPDSRRGHHASRVARIAYQECPSCAITGYQSLGIDNGQILCFYEAGREEALNGHYLSLVDDLLREAADIYRYTGACARITQPVPRTLSFRPKGSRLQPRLRFEQVVQLFERLGTQRFRVRNTAFEQKHRSARETFEYAMEGRHLGFCCDRCAMTEWTGPRYKCTSCDDYDVCSNCIELPVEPHRYRHHHRTWTMEAFQDHQSDHKMDCILPMPPSRDVFMCYVKGVDSEGV